ncbi:MAG: hypothetical protein WBK77_00735 [Alphaproteobacteria bacterium]
MLKLGKFDLERALGCFDGTTPEQMPENVINLTEAFTLPARGTTATPVRGLTLSL